MKTVNYTALNFLFVLMLALGLSAEAQDVRSLVEEGNRLSNSNNFAQAVEKYKAALGVDPQNISARYQIAFSLNALGKSNEALSQLQAVVASTSSPSIAGSSYGLMGNIYDRLGMAEKSISCYLEGIKVDSANIDLHYGLGLAYFRQRQYAKAENSAIAALGINPRHSGSLRLYSLVSFHQNKRAQALLGLCSFLWLDPKGGRSREAYTNIQSILKGGALKAEAGEKTPPKPDPQAAALNNAISRAVAEVAKRKYMVKPDTFAEQLKAVFVSIGETAERQSNNSFFYNRLASFYYRLAKSSNVPAFACVISQNTDKLSSEWLASHQNEVGQLNEWMKKENSQE